MNENASEQYAQAIIETRCALAAAIAGMRQFMTAHCESTNETHPTNERHNNE